MTPVEAALLATGITALAQLVRPLQARSKHNHRDFDKYVSRSRYPSLMPLRTVTSN